MTARPRMLLALVAVLVAGAVATTLVITRDRPTGLARVVAALRDDDRFVNGPSAGETLADASQWLFDDGRSCESARGAEDPRCDARLTAAAYTSVAAVRVAACTAPGVYHTRTALLTYLGAIEAFDDRPLGTTRVPSPPRVDTC